MDLYLILAIAILPPSLWLYTAHLSRTLNPTIREKRICLLIAHPDDEAMFFSPTLLALTTPDLGNHVKILCLSNGNADGLGKVREGELIASVKMLGLRSEDDVLLLDKPDFVDSMTTKWDKLKVADVLRRAFSPSAHKSNRRQASEKAGLNTSMATIDILITFDRHGVSGHPNHIALYHGAKEWLTTLSKVNKTRRSTVDLYTLTSVSLLRKYISVVDVLTTFLFGMFWNMGASQKGNKPKGPRQLLFVSDVMQWRQGQRAMTNGHKSQMRWFRWGWIGFGRYMAVNDLRRQDVA
ncbi:MAG: hypothetical protein LQ351_003227 [Letrouitia transgressa]|nr:MAG: hypothetical protein LQ351_003227 [Letrouitia transgressa]